VATQCVMVDREFSRRPLDRRAGRKKPFDPHPFEVIASLTAPRAVITRYKFGILGHRGPLLRRKFLE
jgi:hypothetical protein